LNKGTMLQIALMALVVFVLIFMGTSVSQDSDSIDDMDTTEADACASCHYPAGAAVMPVVTAEWKTSDHALSYDEGSGANTYCASCKAPFNADPAATYGNNDPVAEEDWMGITCGACHPPHNLRVEWGTPIGTYDVAEDDWSPVYHDNMDDLCTHCHEGARHESVFTPGFGRNMFKKGVTCVDCHMPVVPGDDTYRDHVSHSFDIIPAYSCGTENTDCHDNKDEDWAIKQLEKDTIHNVGFDTDANKPWHDNQGQTKDK
jgi:nitrate/TMAO reductase-like tetraheme cytochrome c subunit